MKRNLLETLIFCAIVLLLAVGILACGNEEGEPGDYDETCYDCDSVCAGAQGAALADCVAKCLECQGYSDCFGWMESHYEGMETSMVEWALVSCDGIATAD